MATTAPDGSANGTTSVTDRGILAPTGAFRMSVSDEEFGYQAPDGSIYIEIVPDGTTGNGVYNARGNLRVCQAEVVTGQGWYAPNGATRVTGLDDVSPVLDFDNAAIWTVAGTGAAANNNQFSASGSAVGALAVVPPLVVGRSYYYSITFTIDANTLQLINGTTTTPVIDSLAESGTMTGTFTAVSENFRIRLTGAGTVVVSELIIV